MTSVKPNPIIPIIPYVTNSPIAFVFSDFSLKTNNLDKKKVDKQSKHKSHGCCHKNIYV